MGGALGVGLRYYGEWKEQQLVWLALPGQLFIRLLKCLSMPVVLSKLVSALGSMEVTLSTMFNPSKLGVYEYLEKTLPN